MSRAAILTLMTALPGFAGEEPRGRFETEGVRIAGTTWVAEDGPLGRVTYHFDPSGLLVYTYPNGFEYRNGTWKQQGTQLYFQINNGFCEFRTAIRADRMFGKSWNKAGEAWSTTLTPKRR